MSDAPLSERATEPGPYRARRLSSSDFGEGDVLAQKYRIEAVLGEGGMGIVLRATHLELGCLVAIKVVRPELAHSEDAVLRLLVEARAAASIRSEHVARVLDVGRLETGAPFLVLEHLEGRDLAQILVRAGRLASQVAVDFVLQACQALSEAHSVGIVHRDLKPENLFLSYRADGTPVVKVLDFGISKRLSHDGREAARTNPSELLGSPLYMSPEQMKGGTGTDARSDIWSLGVVLYELCTGRSPFFGDSLASVCAHVIGVEPAPPSSLIAELDPGLERVILRCLNKDPELRPANIAELAAELAQFGSSDATAYATGAHFVMAGARTNPAFDLAASSERVPMALSATLAVFGEGLRTPRPRRIRPRVVLVGAAAVCASLLGGAFTLRSGQAQESSLLPALPTVAAGVPVAAPPSPQPTAISHAPSTPPASTALAAPAIQSDAVRSRLGDTPRTTFKRPANAGHNSWDPKSFGGRL